LLIVLLTVSGFLLGGVAWYLLRRYLPKYTATTLIKVLSPAEKDPMTIGAAVMQKDIMYGYRSSMAALITQQTSLQELLNRGKIRDTRWFQSFGNIEYEKAKCIRRAFDDLEKRFRAYAERDREFIVLSMTCGNEKEAALIVNEMVDMFLASQGKTSTQEVSNKLAELKEQRDRVDRDLKLAENALAELVKAKGIIDIGTPETGIIRHTITLKLNELEIQKNRLQLQLEQLRAQIGTLENQVKGPITDQIMNLIERDSTVTTLRQRRAVIEAQLAGRLSRFGENHRVVRETRELINETDLRLQDRIAQIAEQTRRANLMNARDTFVVFSASMAEVEKLRLAAEAQQKDLDAARADYEKRLAVRDERQEMLDLIKENIEKHNMLLASPETTKVQFVGYAPAPLDVSSPRWEFYFPGGTVLGMLFAVGLAFLIELLNDLVRTPRDVGRYLHIPLLGVIPDSDEDDQLDDADLYDVIRQAPYSIVSESYRRLRTNIRLSDSADAVKVLLVTSGMAGDGTSSVAVNLAQTFIAENKKVLLIDANFRRPNLQNVFPGPAAQRVGLSSVLMALSSYDTAIRSNVVEGLDIISSGPLPSNPVELLDSPRMAQLIETQRANYDYVIIDSPPVLLVSDPKVLTRHADATLMVFNAGATKRGMAQRAILEMREVKAHIIGCVLFAVRPLTGGYFRQQFRSYQQYQEAPVAAQAT
jgi:capsular exopolysaccharide synthesis family protein